MALADFSDTSIFVAGDVMLDQYLSGATERVSPEAPIPVVKKNAMHYALGGAANVASNLATLGVQVGLAGLIGKDEAGTEMQRLLLASSIDNACLVDADVSTIAKMRVISRQQQLLRVDAEEPFPEAARQQLLKQTLAHLAGQSALIISDYGKGSLADIPALIQVAKKHAIPVLVDPKGTDYQPYRGASIITPNRTELELVVGRCETLDELFSRAESLRNDLELDAIVVTLSEHGLAVIQSGEAALHLPAKAREVFDVTGAGDTLMAVLAASLAAGESLPAAAQTANLAAAIAVGKFGASPVTLGELRAAVSQSSSSASLATAQVVVQEQELLRQVAEAKAAGERIVMTNGCFDLLHPGHINFLNEVAAQGDRVIVAVNDDASVQRLKGESRPLNPLADRQAMLAGLRSVDWVVAFSEDTPERIISEVSPDVLVKGGDYKPEEIAGYNSVTAAGGEVKVLGFMEGYSSTALLEKIRADEPVADKKK